MENTIEYRGFQLQISLDIANEQIVGELVPDENFKDLKFWMGKDSLRDLIEEFEDYIQTFLSERKETFIYKNVTLEIAKLVGGKWKGYSNYFIHFEGETLDEIKLRFINDVDALEEHARIWNELQNTNS